MKTEILICRFTNKVGIILKEFFNITSDKNIDISKEQKEVLLLKLDKLFSETHPHVWVDYIEGIMPYDKVKDYTYMVFLPERKQVVFIKYSEPKEFDEAELDIDENEYFLCYNAKEIQFPEFPYKDEENLNFWSAMTELAYVTAMIRGYEFDDLFAAWQEAKDHKIFKAYQCMVEEKLEQNKAKNKTKEEPLKFPAYVQGGLWAMAEERKTLQHWIDALCDDMDLIEKGKNRNKTTYTRETLNRAFDKAVRRTFNPDEISFEHISNFDTSKDDYTSIYIPCTGFMGKKDAHQMIEEIMNQRYLKPCYRGIIGEDGVLRISGVDMCEDSAVAFNDTLNRAYSMLNGLRKIKHHTGKKNKKHRLTLTIEKLK